MRHRLRYYSKSCDRDPCHISDWVAPRERFQITQVAERLADRPAWLVVITTSHNRGPELARLYRELTSQRQQDWRWLIIDNGSKSGHQPPAEAYRDSRVAILTLRKEAGCAFPARNLGLDIVEDSIKSYSAPPPWVLSLDSDDGLFDEYAFDRAKSLKRLGECQNSTALYGHGLTTWFSGDRGETTTMPDPDGKDYPRLEKPSLFFDEGLTIQSSIISPAVYTSFRYPPEFSFEDNGLNVKLALHSRRRCHIIPAVDEPIVVKRSSDNTMISRNGSLGASAEGVELIGTHRATGVRARIVRYLKRLRDLYLREGC